MSRIAKGYFDVSQIYNKMAAASNERYQKDGSIEDAISFILFEALSIEANINYVGEQFYPDKKYFRDKISKIHPILVKLDTITRHVAHDDFPEGLLKHWIEALFLMRNELAHAKANYSEIDLDVVGYLSPKEQLQCMQGEFGFTYKESGKFVSIHDVIQNTQGIYFEFFFVFSQIMYSKNEQKVDH